MNTFIIKFSFNAPYPKTNEYRESASTMSAAVSRAIRNWKKDNKGKRINEVIIKVTKL